MQDENANHRVGNEQRDFLLLGFSAEFAANTLATADARQRIDQIGFHGGGCTAPAGMRLDGEIARGFQSSALPTRGSHVLGWKFRRPREDAAWRQARRAIFRTNALL